MSGSRLQTWLHRVGYLTTVTVLAALGYVGYTHYRDWKEPHRVAASGHGEARAPQPPPAGPSFPYALQAVWSITTKSSFHPEPRTVRICMNDDAAPAELRTCAGVLDYPRTDVPTANTVSCADQDSKATTSVTVSNDWRAMRYRSDYTFSGEKSWSESTMTYGGECPAPMKDDQRFLLIRPDGKVVDPYPATACMVTVLNADPGVTEPKVGYVWDLQGGPRRFVRYTYRSRGDDRPGTITFTAEEDVAGDATKAIFHTSMSGKVTPEGKRPDQFGAARIVRLWKARCGVQVGISYE